ncbi:MAG: ribulose-phosphate 3-epimerase, partial [Clostridia bacterium]|nr:ribulose-phosphate 3-epimerase [Clostridia bacterium]
LVMSVFPGFGGQKFIPSVLDKVREIRAIAGGLGLPLDIQIDGGINEETAVLAREAGANILVAGNAVFKAENRADMIAKLKA